MRVPLPLIAPLTIGATFPGMAFGHASERMVILTLPTRAYFWGAAAAIIVTLVLGAWGWTPRFRQYRIASIRTLLPEGTLNWISFVCLWLLIAAGTTGTHDPLTNPLSVGFWIGFWVLLPLLTVCFGNIWRGINPWTAPVRVTRRLLGRNSGPGLSRLGYWPACFGFFSFAWFETVSLAPSDPLSLALVIALYWLLMFFIGIAEGEHWFETGEAFGAYFTLLSRIAPIWSIRSGKTRELFAGWPGAQILPMPPLAPGGFAFITLVLAAVSFDGLSETFFWLALNGINPLEFPGRSAVTLVNTAGLAGTWLTIALLIQAALIAGRRLSGQNTVTTPDIRLTAMSFLPISAGYHIAHYLVALLTNGQYAVVAIGDPFSLHWNLLNLPPTWVSFSFLSDPGTVRLIWNIQFALILGAHILAVLLALRLPEREGYCSGTRQHIPMAMLMILLTIFGLWLLSAPTGT